MGIFARLFGAVPRNEWSGIRLDEPEPWRVAPTKEVERFLRALPLLCPEGSVAYFEATGEQHVAAFLREVSIPATVKVAVGTIWPKPDCYHVPLTAEMMETIADFLEKRPAGYVCSHFHVYRDGIVLLEWHDAFMDDPLYISRTIDNESVGRFAHALGSSYAPDPRRP